MKSRRVFSAARLSFPFATAIVALLAASHAQATILYWDLNGATANTAVAVTGAWNGTNTFWNTIATGGSGGTVQAGTTNADDLIFSSGSTYTTGTVTASGTRAARSLTFEDNIVITLAGAITVGGSGGTPGIFAPAGKATATTVSGAITLASACTYENNGAGLLTLSGNQVLGANTLTKSGTGAVTASAVVSGTKAAASNAISITGGVLTLSGANTFSGDISVAGSTAVLSITGVSGGGFTTNSRLGNQASVYKTVSLTNGGTFQLASSNYNVNTPTSTNVGAGQVFNIGTGGGTFDVASGSTFTLDDGTGAGTAWSNTQLQGSGTLTKTGAGTLSLGNAATSNAAFTGQILVNAGVLRLGAVTGTGVALGSTGANTVIASGAAFDIGANTGSTSEPVSITGAGVGGTGNVIFTSATTTTPSFNGPITLAGNSTIGSTTAGAMTFGSGATFDLGANTLTIRNTSTGRVFTDGVISGTTGAFVMNSSGSGDYIPRADHTYSGGTTLTAGAIAVDRDSIGAPGSPTSGPFGTGTLTFAGGQMRCGTGSDRTVGNTIAVTGSTTFYTTTSEKTLTFTGPVTLSGGNHTITANVGATVAGKSTVFSGAVGEDSPGRSLTKAGTGNLTLGGANTYTGGTTVNSGTMILTGSLASSTALTVVPTVAGGAVFTLGSGAANPLTAVSALTLDSTTGPVTLGFDLGANTAASDSIATSAAATATGTVNIAVQALSGFGSPTTFDLITAAGGLNGAAYALSSAPGGYTYSLTGSATAVQLGVTPTTAGDLYWRGDTSNSWSAFNGTNSNWYSDGAGITNAQANPGAGDTVIFSASNAALNVGAVSTVLNNHFTINDIVFGSNPIGVSAVTIGGGISPAGNVGILTVAPASSTDGVNVGANAGSVTISAPVAVGANQTWLVDGTGANGSSLTITGPLSGSAALAINGLVTMSSAAGTSTYSGTLTVPDGAILRGGATNSLSTAMTVAVNGTGILSINGLNNNIGALSGTGIVENGHAATGATLTVGAAGTNTTFSGTLQNGNTANLALVKTGTGTLTLSGNNTFTGSATVNAGSLLMGSNTALSGSNSVTVAGTGTFDLNGFSATTGAITSADLTAGITNSSTSTAPSTATALNTPAGAGVYVDAWTSPTGGNVSALISDGPTRKTQIVINNANGNANLLNDANSFSGGLVLLHNASGSRLTVGAVNTGSRLGTGPVIIGQSPTDKAGVYFSVANNTIANPIIFNTALGTDRVGIRTDAANITLDGVITANLAPATFTANTATAGSFFLTNQVTGPEGLVLDITSLGASATQFLVTLNNGTVNANNYQGDTVINLNAASGKSATLALGQANQIPNGTGKGNVVINSNGTGIGLLSLGGFDETVNGLSGNGNVDGVSGTPTLTIGDNDATATHSGSINNTAGTLSVTKIGTGTQTLSGTSNFAGDVTVNGGLLAFPSSPAASGPLGNSTVVKLSGGGISYTGTSASDLNRPVAIGASAGTLDVASSAGTLNILSVTSSGGDLVKTGPGTAVINGSTTLNGGAADVAVNAGTLQAGFGSAGVATIAVSAAGNLDQRNGATEALVLDGTAGALTLAGGAQIGFDLNGALNDSITVDVGGTAATNGTVTLNLYGTPTAGTYTLLSAPGGLSGATYALGAAPNGFNYTITATATSVTVNVQPFTPIYWRGGLNLSWSSLGSGPANWTTDAGGVTDALSIPVPADTVLFSATGVAGPTLATTLDGAFTVDSLQFTNVPSGITSVAIDAGSGGALTLSPASTSGGIRVLAGAGSATISAPLTVAANQTWDVDASGSLIVSGSTAFNANVNKTNSGVLTLSGSNTGSSTFTLSGGTLNLDHDAALGFGTFAIGAGATINSPLAVRTLSTNNTQSWNGDFTFAGTNALNLGTGAVTINNSIVAVNTAASTLTVGGGIGDGGNSRILAKTGAGTLELTGANTFGGGLNLNSGTLLLGHSNALGTGVLRINGAATVASNAAVVTANIVEANSNFTVGGTNELTLGELTLNANRTITNSNTTALTTLGGISGTTTNVTFAGDGNTTVAGAIATTTGSVTKSGTGTLTLAGVNTFTGNAAVNAGTMTVSGSISSGAANVTVGSGSVGTLTVANGGSITTTGTMNLGSGIIGNNFNVQTGGTVNVGSINNPWATNYTVDGTLTSAGTWNVSSNNTTSTFNGSGIITAPALTLGNATTGLNYSGTGTINIAGNVTVASNNGAGAPFYTQSSGTLNANGMLLGDNTTNSSGSRTFNLTGGRVNIGSTGIAATGSTAATKAVNLGAGTLGARANWTSSLNMALTAVSPATTSIDTLDSVDNTTGRTVTLTGILSGSGGLTKSGAGTLVLSGANTYAGSTSVNGGTLQLNGSAATNPTTSDVTVGAAGTLGFTAGSASTLNLSAKDLTLNGGTLAFDIGNATVNDMINVDDFILTANSALAFTSIGAIDGTYTLITSTNPITNTGSYTLSGQTVGRVTLTPTINSNTVTVSSSVSEGKWNVTGGGNWSDGDPNATAGNWLGYKPTVDGDAALFGDSITAPATVLVDTPHTASYIRFDNANAYTIGTSGGNNLTLGNSLGAALLSVTTGSHTLAENLALTSNLSILPSSGTTLAITGNTSGSGRSISVNGAGDVTVTGAIATTTGGLVKDGPGVLTMSGASTYLGTTEVKGGILNLTGSVTGNTTTSTFAYGTTAGNTVVNHSGNLTAFVTTGANAVGSVSVFNQTAGSVTIVPTNANDTQWVARTGYGALNITGGTFNTGRFDVTAPGGTSGAGVAYVGGGGILNQNVGDWFILTRTHGNSQLTVGPGGTVARAAGVTAPFALTMDGANSSATLNVAGGSVSTGATRGLQVGFGNPGAGNTSFVNLASGTLSMGLNMIKSGTTGSTATFFNFAGGTLKSNATMSEVITPNGTGHTITSTIFGPVTNNINSNGTFNTQIGVASNFAGGLVIDTNGFATTFTNVFNAASGVGVTQADIGDVSALAGNLDYIGAPAVNFSAPAAAGATPASGYAVISGGKVQGIVITNPGVYASGETPTVTLTGGGGTIAPFATPPLSTPNTSGGLTKQGDGILALSGVSTYTGATLVSAGTLQIGAAGTAGGISPSSAITNNSVFAVNRTNAVVQGTDFGTIGGTGSFTQAGTGTTTLNVANTYLGGTSITAGVLQASHNNALGSGTVAVNGGIRLTVNAGVDIPNAVTLGTNAGATGRGLIEAVGTSGTATVSGPITINNSAAAGGHFNAAAGTVLHLQGAITSSVQVSQRDGTVMFSGGGTGYSSMILTGTTIIGAVDGIATSANVIIGGSAAATLDLNGLNQSLVGITKGGSAATIGNSSTTTDSVLTTTGTSSFAGVIKDVIGAGTRKVGLTVASGSLTLSGVNTYTGNTSVTGGTLIVTGSIASTASVATTGTLAGNGTIAGTTTVATTGVVSPGNSSIGTLNFSDDLTLDSGSEYAVGITGAATHDKVTVTDTLTANGTIKVTLSGYTPVANDTFDIADAATTTGTPTFDFSAATLPAGLIWNTSTFATNGQIKVVVDYYGIWAGGTFANMPFTNNQPGQDHDSDTLTNLREYAFGTDPTENFTGPLARSGSTLTERGQPILEVDGGVYYAVFCRRMDYLAAGLTYKVEFSNALSSWTTTATVPTPVADDGEIEAVRVPFLNFVPSDSGPQKPTFFRVEVSQ